MLAASVGMEFIGFRIRPAGMNLLAAFWTVFLKNFSLLGTSLTAGADRKAFSVNSLKPDQSALAKFMNVQLADLWRMNSPFIVRIIGR